MKKAILIFSGAAIFSLALASCNNAPAAMDAAAMTAKADSIYKAGSQHLIDSMNTNCTTAGAAKAKAVCDSVCAANGIAM